MTPHLEDTDFALYIGDALDVLRGLPAESVHCVVTSPPYWGLRDYGATGQLGLEATPELYVARMVEVFAQVRRVLRSDGTLWLNIGDSYNANQGAGFNAHKDTRPHLSGDGVGQKRIDAANRNTTRKRPPGIKPKDLVGIPWRLAFALQADGWYLRSDIIWSKPNPMPESVTDRPTKAHEYLFLLTKSAKYHYDQDAIREKYQDGPGLTGGAYAPPGQAPHGNARGPDGRHATRVVGADGSIQHRDGERWPNGGRNRRSVWEVATEPYPDAHFATYPQALIEPCIKAGTSEHGCCPVCGAPWTRETDVDYDAKGRTTNGPRSIDRRHETAGFTQRLEKHVTTTGWRPGCTHDAAPVPCVVLDPFLGSGTTALVARRHGRRSIGIELSPEYARLAAQRLSQLSLLAEMQA